MAKGNYYYEKSYHGPFPDLFEAGSNTQDGFVEARPFGLCRNSVPASKTMSGYRDCERPAVAKIPQWDDMPVCHKHLEEIKADMKRAGDCICEWREPNYEEGEYDWQLIEHPECPVNHSDKDALGGE